MPADAPAGPPVVGPQLPSTQGGGECQWTAPALVRVKLPGDAEAREVEASVIDGRAVFEGDIVLTRGLETLGVGHSDVGRRWPNKTVIYDIHPALPNAQRVTDAIAHWEANTVIKFKRRKAERTEAGADGAEGEAGRRLATVLYNLAEALRLIALHVAPFLPATAEGIAGQLGIPLAERTDGGALAWGGYPAATRVRPGGVLFPKVEAPVAAEE